MDTITTHWPLLHPLGLFVTRAIAGNLEKIARRDLMKIEHAGLSGVHHTDIPARTVNADNLIWALKRAGFTDVALAVWPTAEGNKAAVR